MSNLKPQPLAVAIGGRVIYAYPVPLARTGHEPVALHESPVQGSEEFGYRIMFNENDEAVTVDVWE